MGGREIWGWKSRPLSLSGGPEKPEFMPYLGDPEWPSDAFH